MTAPTAIQLDAGVHDISPIEYQRDPCPAPSLSASIADILVKKSPAHAWLKHPRLNPDAQPDHKTIYDVGTAIHAVALRDPWFKPEIIEAADFRTKAAQQARDAAYAGKRTPLLTHQWEQVEAAAARLIRHIEHDTEIAEPFAKGDTEQTLIWQEDGIWLRCRPDRIASPNGRLWCLDIKSTGADATPDGWAKRQLWDTSAAVQGAVYRRAFRALFQSDIHLRWIVVETYPPYEMQIFEPSGLAIEIADAMLDEAIARWRWCLQHDQWPGYPRRVCRVDPPIWVQRGHQERQLLRDTDPELFQLVTKFQAPLELTGL